MSPLPSKQSRNQRRLRRPRRVTPARWVAWLTVRRTFDEDAWTDRAFTAAAEQLGLGDDPRERGFAQQLAYGVVQHAKQLDHVIAVLGKRPLHKIDAPVLHALRIGVFELLHLQQQTGPGGERLGSTSAHAAVDQAVELVRGVVGERAVAFTNAILRRAQVDGAAILDRLDPIDDADRAVQLSMPDWLVTRARAAHGEQGIAALAAQNHPRAGTALRRNVAHPRHAELDSALEQLDVEWKPACIDGIELPDAIIVSGATGPLGALIDEGLLVPQSLASQLVALALDPQPGERVLDMCAAPGGKTTHLARRMQGSGCVLAVELHEHRARSIQALAERTHTADLITVRTADATTLSVEELGTFDRILLDAPCTGTGVLAARPDARWKRSEDGVEELVELQRRLLATAATLLAPGGTLVYSTCSILAEEDEQIVAGRPEELAPAPFRDDEPLLRAVAVGEGHELRTWPQVHDTEGFYVARLTRPTTDAED